MANRVSIMRKVGGEWIASDASKRQARIHKVGVDPHKTEGGKRRGKAMARKAREELSGNIMRDALIRVSAIDPLAEVTTVADGRRVKMIRYIDPSRKRGA